MIRLEDCSVLIEDGLERNQTIVFACSCEITYSGKTEIFLSEGDRIVIVKKDKSLVMHRPEGSIAVLATKPGATISAINKEGKLVVRSHNIAEDEFLDLLISKVYFFEKKNLEDNQNMNISGTEKDMAKVLRKNPSIIEKGFRPLNIEEHIKHDYIDVLGYDPNNTLAAVLCKRKPADIRAIAELRHYIERIKTERNVSEVRGIIACPAISDEVKQILASCGFLHVELKPPKHIQMYDASQQTLTEFSK